MEIVKKSFSEIEKDWNSIVNQQHNFSPFHTYEYAKCMMKEYRVFCGRRGNPEFYLISENDDVLMICPVSRHKNGQVFSFGFEMGVVHEDFIYSDSLSEKKIYECIVELIKLIGPIRFGFVSQDSRLYQIARQNQLITNESQGINGLINLPDTYDKYYSLLSKKMKQTIRSAKNRLKLDGLNDSIKIIYGKGMTKFEYLKFSKVYANSKFRRYDLHKRTIIGSIFHWIFAVFFQHNAYALNNVDESVCVVYTINNKVATVMGGFADKIQHKVIFHRVGFDMKYKKYSPGILMFQKLIKLMIENTDFKILDLTIGGEEYKFRLGCKEYFDVWFDLTI